MKTLWLGYRPPVRVRVYAWTLWLSFGHRAQVQFSVKLDMWVWWWPKPTHHLACYWLGPFHLTVSR